MPASVLAGIGTVPLSCYVHVPFCAARCGYCDFNTYLVSAAELNGANPAGYLRAAHAEIDLARRILGPDVPGLSTVFFGGGTPTLLPAADLVGLLDHLRSTFGLLPGAEVTTEANPESVSETSLDTLFRAGFTRLSLGMQSVVPGVLATLERRHTSERPLALVPAAHAAGFPDVSLDLIYGTPGESLADWQASLDAAIGVEPDHISAYALVVEDGTPLARKVRRGEIAAPDDDDLADKYLLADKMLSQAGYQNYEISNWSRGVEHRARHNMAYWLGHNWWGIGPGAHSHLSGEGETAIRWWNVRHPRAYADHLNAGHSPRAGQEVLDAAIQHEEQVLLELRLADGLAFEALTPTELARVPGLVRRGLLETQPGLLKTQPGRLRLTLDGRLLADAVVRDLLD